MELLCSGGQGESRRLSDHGDRKATLPDHVAARSRSNFRLILGILIKYSRPAMTRDLRTNRSLLQGKISSIFATDAPQGRLRYAKGGILAVPPPKWRTSALHIDSHS